MNEAEVAAGDAGHRGDVREVGVIKFEPKSPPTPIEEER